MHPSPAFALAAFLVAPALAAPFPSEQRAGVHDRQPRAVEPVALAKTGTAKSKTVSGSDLTNAFTDGVKSAGKSAALSEVLHTLEGFFSPDASNSTEKRSVQEISPEELEALRKAAINKYSSFAGADETQLHRRDRRPAKSASGSKPPAAEQGKPPATKASTTQPAANSPGPAAAEPEPSKSDSGSKDSFFNGIVNSAANGGTNAVVGGLIDAIEGIFHHSSSNSTAKRSIGDLTSEEKEVVKTALINKISTLSDADLAKFQKRAIPSEQSDLLVVPRSANLSSLGPGIAPAAAPSIISTIIDQIEHLFSRDQVQARSLAGTAAKVVSKFGADAGKAAAKGVAAGAGNAFASNVIEKIEDLFNGGNQKRDISDLSDEEKQVVKEALINKVSSLSESDLAKFQRRAAPANSGSDDLSNKGAVQSIGGSPVGSSLIGDIIKEIENLLKRTNELEVDDLD